MNGGEPIAITGKDYSGSPDGALTISIFLARKKEDDKAQVWISNRMGGDAEVLTKIPQGTSSHEWLPAGINYFWSLRIQNQKN
jgi:hypothetical protein